MPTGSTDPHQRGRGCGRFHAVLAVLARQRVGDADVRVSVWCLAAQNEPGMVFISGVRWKLLNSVPGRCGRFERVRAAARRPPAVPLQHCCPLSSRCGVVVASSRRRRDGVAWLRRCIVAWLRSHLFHRLKPAPQFVIDRTDDVVDEHYEPQPLVEHVTVGTHRTTEYRAPVAVLNYGGED